MIATEDVAKRDWWCPHARARFVGDSRARFVGDSDDVSIGRDDGGKACPSCMCLASGCAAWRWVDHLEPRRKGYCGAFGRPQEY
jgi:hypothetical protein